MDKNFSPTDLPAVAILTVTRNRRKLVLRMLSQLQELDYPREQLDIYMVDSASCDDTVEAVQQEFPEVHLTIYNENLGIAAGFNASIKAAMNATRKYKYFWLLDSDVQIEPQTLLPLVKTAESDPGIAVVGSAVYEPDRPDRLVTAGFHVDWRNCNVAFNVPADSERDGLFEVELIPACSSLTRAELYYKQGLWDERLWLYWGDTEWCMRSIRNGYRVFCTGKSRVWHHSWANVKPDFSFPYIIHDRVRSALLFNLCYSPDRSLAGLRRFILKSYLKAAFENCTVRPNFSRAYHEGVQDFLKGDFSKKDFSSWAEGFEIDDIDRICSRLSKRLPKQPRIILNHIADEAQKHRIKQTFEKNFNGIIWEEISVHKDFENTLASDRMREYMFFHFPRLLLRTLAYYKRKDLIISPVSLPCLYQVAAAKYTMLLSSSMQACVQKNNISTAFWNVFKTVFKGVRVAYFSLPSALNNCDVLKKANAAQSNLITPDSPGNEIGNTP